MAWLTFQSLLEEGLILHASGNSKHKFIFGFYLYYFSYPKAKSGGSVSAVVIAGFHDDIDWLIDDHLYSAIFSALLSRLIALACGSTWVTSFL